MSHNFAVTVITISTKGEQACISNSHVTSIAREEYIQDYLERYRKFENVSHILVIKSTIGESSTIIKKYSRNNMVSTAKADADFMRMVL
jgi:hypothetical protein